jgi:hypothetical protein
LEEADVDAFSMAHIFVNNWQRDVDALASDTEALAKYIDLKPQQFQLASLSSLGICDEMKSYKWDQWCT